MYLYKDWSTYLSGYFCRYLCRYSCQYLCMYLCIYSRKYSSRHRWIYLVVRQIILYVHERLQLII